MCAEATKKSFGFGEKKQSLLFKLMEKIFSPRKKSERPLDFSRTVFFNQLQKKKTHFLDSQEKSHEVTWKSPRLEKFLSKLKEKAAVEKLMHSQARKKLPKSYEENH